MAVVEPPVISLDLGTLHLRAAVFRDKQVQLIKDELGHDTILNYVGFNRQPAKETIDSAILLGRHAYDLAQKDLILPVYGLKKLLGKRADNPVVLAEKACVPFAIVAGEDGLAAIKPPGESAKVYKPEELLSMLVRKVIGNADVQFGVPVREAVVTIPSCFTFMDRERVTQLCSSAGIRVIRMVNEAWAAVIAHGFDAELVDEINAIVISVGAGFLDIACITIDDTIYEVCASYGCIVTPNMLDEFNSENFQSIIKFVNLVHAHSKVTKIDQVFLSGGSPFLSSLQKVLHDLFIGCNPTIVSDPSTATVRGAAVHAAILGGEQNKHIQEILILPATNFALGIKTADNKIRTVISQNHTYAAKEERHFTTSIDNQTTVVFEVYEKGEQGGVTMETFLGEVVLSDLPPLQKGKIVLDVTMDIDFNYVIAVTVGYAKLNLKKRLVISKVQCNTPLYENYVMTMQVMSRVISLV